MEAYYFVIFTILFFLWWLSSYLWSGQEEILYFNQLAGWGLSLAGLFPLLLSFLEITTVFFLLALFSSGISRQLAGRWHFSPIPPIAGQAPTPVVADFSPALIANSISDRQFQSKEVKIMSVPAETTAATETSAETPPTFSMAAPTVDIATEYLEAIPLTTETTVTASANTPIKTGLIDHLIDSGFNAYSGGRQDAAAKAFYQLWQNSRDPDLLCLVTGELLKIYRERGEYRRAVQLGGQTLDILADSAPAYSWQINQEIEYIQELLKILIARGEENLPYSSLSGEVKQEALGTSTKN